MRSYARKYEERAASLIGRRPIIAARGRNTAGRHPCQSTGTRDATAPEGNPCRRRGSRSDDAIAVATVRSSNKGGTRAEGVGRAVPP